ncbi:MAG: DNA polymerase I, partial [Clostridia bacterium]|nr:DNA polymerase I [Clostridia bacterium]
DIAYPEKVVCKSYDEAVKFFNGCKEFSVALEQNSAEIYAYGKQISLKLPDGLITDDGINYDDYISVLRFIFENSDNRVITFACKDLMHDLQKLGVEFKCAFDDVSLSKYLCDYTNANVNLKELCEYYSYDYSFSAFAVYELFKKYRAMLEADNMVHLYEDIEKPLLSVLFDMETEGVAVSTDTLNDLAKRYESLIAEYKQKIYDGCGCEFNVNSPTQLGDVLYNKLGITSVRKKSTGKYTTSADVLEKLCDDYPVINDVLKFRQYQKLYSTYLEGFRPLINKSGFIHTTFNQTITSTGRLSSANPNLQNIPIREEEGKELRKIFIPREGNVFIDADYSQIELRMLAHFSGCKELIQAYNEGVDIHTVTASQVFGVPIGEVTPKMRREAKAVNFGIIYGISDFGLAHNLGISVSTAREY